MRINNEHKQLMDTLEKASPGNEASNHHGNFMALSAHLISAENAHIVTLTESAARFWLWLLDERARSEMLRGVRAKY